MTNIAIARRKMLETGACALVAAPGLLMTISARREAGSDTATEEIIRKWYKAWVDKDESQFEALMADNFTPRVKAILRANGCSFVRHGKGDQEIGTVK